MFKFFNLRLFDEGATGDAAESGSGEVVYGVQDAVPEDTTIEGQPATDEGADGQHEPTPEEREEAYKATSENIRARGQRPQENGASKAPGIKVVDDVEALTDDDIDAIKERIRRGEKIDFTKR